MTARGTTIFTALMAAALTTAEAGAQINLIRGKVLFQGDPEKYQREVIDTAADPKCAESRTVIATEDVLINNTEPATVRNALVYVRQGAEGFAFPKSNAEERLVIHGCRLDPHIMGIIEGQPLKIVNVDDTRHQLKIHSRLHEPQTLEVPPRTDAANDLLQLRAEPPVKITCEKHPWEAAYVGVFTHPFFDITERDGEYLLKGMPPGRYVVEAWHEVLGTVTAVVIVERDGQYDRDLVFKQAGWEEKKETGTEKKPAPAASDEQK